MNGPSVILLNYNFWVSVNLIFYVTIIIISKCFDGEPLLCIYETLKVFWLGLLRSGNFWFNIDVKLVREKHCIVKFHEYKYKMHK